MPDTETTLTPDQLKEIEARLKQWDRGEVSKQTFPASWANVDALCRSLRAAWADVARFSELADKRHDELCEARRQRDSLAADMNTYIRDATAALRERLAQVEQERNDARRKLARRCTHPNTYPLGAASRRCHDCGWEILL